MNRQRLKKKPTRLTLLRRQLKLSETGEAPPRMDALSFRIKPAKKTDLDALFSLAEQASPGLTSLPHNRDYLASRIAQSIEAMACTDSPENACYLFVAEVGATGEIAGTANVTAMVGSKWPFYSYRINRQTHSSVELGWVQRYDVLHLVNDFDGASEVGGLFLDPQWQKTGVGRLLARSRYLFIAQARERFAERVIADLRGYRDEQGGWPFWDALGGKFFGMRFEDADELNGIRGNQFIADLMPRYPIYACLLPEIARNAIGKVHCDGRGAFRLLLEEGFVHDSYVDIFDAGPTVHARTDALRAIRDSAVSTIDCICPLPTGELKLVAAGRLANFRATAGVLEVREEKTCRVTPQLAEMLQVNVGDEVRHVGF